ncbi:MFS transporter [Aeromonas jandaei]|uniref:MFS transporter n=1 Tax=Aeromonas jandaei TaxID=650 RepID=UPI003BA2638F
MKTNFFLFGMAFLVFLAEAEIDIVVPSFPGMMNYYGTSVAQTEWVLTLNLIAHGIAGLVIGSLADIYGKRKTLLAGLTVFILGSVLTIFSGSFELLLLGRILQGAGMASPMVVGYLILIQGVNKSEKEQRIATLNGVANISLAFSPAIGGLFVAFFSWHASFKLLLALGIIALLITLRIVPKDRQEHATASSGAYSILLKDSKQLKLILATLFLPAAWFTFVGLSSILYVNYMGVPVMQYAFHQGGIALFYGLISLYLYKIIQLLSKKVVEILSLALLILATIGIIAGYILNWYTPAYVTTTMLIGSVGSIYLTNRSQVLAVTYRSAWAGKVSALIMLGRWLLTAILLQIAGGIYQTNESLTIITVALSWIAGGVFIWIVSKEHNLTDNDSVS